MQLLLNQGLSDQELEGIRNAQTLEDVLRWGSSQPRETRCAEIIADFVVHDEFTHDVLVPWKGLWLVYHAT
jgi:hypothetical protein